MDAILKTYLPIYLLGYLAVAFIVPSLRIYKQTGINPITFGKRDNAHDYIGFIMKLLIALLFIAVFIFSFAGDGYNFLVPIPFLENSFLDMAGLVIIHVSLLWIIIAQHQMSRNWRIGIDEEHKTELVTRGLFSISRNPVFLGMILSVFGLFLILPNTLSFFLASTTYIIIQIQIRLEEEFLIKQHGEKYFSYKSKTKRLI